MAEYQLVEQLQETTTESTEVELKSVDAGNVHVKDESLLSLKEWQADTPHEIELSVTLQYIGNIDALNESFDARLWIDIFWLPSKTELLSNSEPTEWDLESNLQTTNAISLNSFDIIKSPQIKDIKGRMMYHAVVQISGTFSSPFDMHSFPFDTQKLYITLEMGNVKNMVYKPASHLQSIFSIETQSCVLREWECDGINISYTASDASLSKQGNRYAQCIMRLILPRVWISFGQRYLVIMASLTFAEIAVFSIDYNDVADRLGYIFTLLLTTVAFAFIVSEKLPSTSYLTLFDQYYITCILIVFINVIFVSLAPIMIEDYEFKHYDKIMLIITVLAIVVTHILFIIKSFQSRKNGIARIKALDLQHGASKQNIKVFKNDPFWFPHDREQDQTFFTYKSLPKH